MKIFTALVLFAVLLFSSSAFAQNSDSSPAGFWNGLEALVARCAVHPYTTMDSGEKTYGPMESVCADLKINGSSAVFVIDGEVFVATLQDSADSDGGDLNDVTVADSHGDVIITQQNVLAYRDIVVALVGRSVKFSEVYVPEL
jgi:hypothetical protein